MGIMVSISCILSECIQDNLKNSLKRHHHNLSQQEEENPNQENPNERGRWHVRARSFQEKHCIICLPQSGYNPRVEEQPTVSIIHPYGL